MPYKRMVLTIPDGMRGQVQGVRVPTPISDELEERLAEYVARLEADSPNGRHPAAARLAYAVGAIRKAEVDCSGADPNVPRQRIEQAREIVAWAKQVLDRMDVGELLKRMGGSN